jgi:hypothetical protein
LKDWQLARDLKTCFTKDTFDKIQGEINRRKDKDTKERMERKAARSQAIASTSKQPAKPKQINIHTDLTAEQRAAMAWQLRDAVHL